MLRAAQTWCISLQTLIFVAYIKCCTKFTYMNCVVPENIHTPPTEGILPMTHPPLWIFHKMDPPSPPEIPFLSHTPRKYYHSLWKPKISYFFSARYRILILTVFFSLKNLVETVTESSPEGTSPTSRMHITEFAI